MNEKMEEYNNGGLMDAATLVNLFTSSTGTGFGSFSLPKEKTVDLIVDHVVDTRLVHDDPAGMEQYIRNDLARKLAQQLIEEDVIQIQSCEDIDHRHTTFRAKVKVVQE